MYDGQKIKLEIRKKWQATVHELEDGFYKKQPKWRWVRFAWMVLMQNAAKKYLALNQSIARLTILHNCCKQRTRCALSSFCNFNEFPRVKVISDQGNQISKLRAELSRPRNQFPANLTLFRRNLTMSMHLGRVGEVVSSKLATANYPVRLESVGRSPEQRWRIAEAPSEDRRLQRASSRVHQLSAAILQDGRGGNSIRIINCVSLNVRS